MATEENGFLEYLQLQEADDLVTKSELISAVRRRGYSLSDRQLTFYVSEELVPRSVRVGSRAGAYPKIVVELMTWILRSRNEGLPIDALRELLPVWKFLIRARNERVLNVGELEYVARQHVTSIEGALAVPRVISYVMRRCGTCLSEVEVVHKDGSSHSMSEVSTTLGFALAWTPEGGDGEQPGPQWFATTRLSLATPQNFSTDPSTVILGLKPNAPLPAEPLPVKDERHVSHGSEEARI